MCRLIYIFTASMVKYFNKIKTTLKTIVIFTVYCLSNHNKIFTLVFILAPLFIFDFSSDDVKIEFKETVLDIIDLLHEILINFNFYLIAVCSFPGIYSLKETYEAVNYYFNNIKKKFFLIFSEIDLIFSEIDSIFSEIDSILFKFKQNIYLYTYFIKFYMNIEKILNFFLKKIFFKLTTIYIFFKKLLKKLYNFFNNKQISETLKKKLKITDNLNLKNKYINLNEEKIKKDGEKNQPLLNRPNNIIFNNNIIYSVLRKQRFFTKNKFSRTRQYCKNIVYIGLLINIFFFYFSNSIFYGITLNFTKLKFIFIISINIFIILLIIKYLK